MKGALTNKYTHTGICLNFQFQCIWFWFCCLSFSCPSVSTGKIWLTNSETVVTLIFLIAFLFYLVQYMNLGLEREGWSKCCNPDLHHCDLALRFISSTAGLCRGVRHLSIQLLFYCWMFLWSLHFVEFGWFCKRCLDNTEDWSAFWWYLFGQVSSDCRNVCREMKDHTSNHLHVSNLITSMVLCHVIGLSKTFLRQFSFLRWE